MRALAATLSLDFRLQARNGFYYAVAFVLACWFVLLTLLPDIDWGYVLPAVVFGNLVMVNFYFVAGLVLLEKGEGTLEAQVVTPLADWQYIGSKTATLTALSLVEQVVIVWSAHGGGVAGGPPRAGSRAAGGPPATPPPPAAQPMTTGPTSESAVSVAVFEPMYCQSA
ncbi:MAG: hypothetical protein OXF27_13205, partial [Acidobacteria bacterium]|nr:hypothetical protein [Acidobacteriota bacterium]